MRKAIIYACLFVFAVSGIYAGDLQFTVSVDWQLSIQGGVEYRSTTGFGVKADLGISVMGLITADLYGMYFFTDPDDPWQIAVAAGIPNIGAPVTFEGIMVSLGGAVEVKRAVSESIQIGAIVGAGFPFFFEEGTDVIRDTSFPLDLWPEAALIMSIAPR